MKAFFDKKDTRDLTVTQSRKLSCFSCGLYKNVKSPKMEPYGNFKKKIMVIGDHPDKQDDRRGKPFTGGLLEDTLLELGIDLFEDCVSLNAINCFVNRKPSPNEFNCCRDVKVLKAIAKYKPKIILLLGGDSLTSFLGHRWKKGLGGIATWRGWKIPDQDYKAWVCPTYHPSYVERINIPELTMVWKQDLINALTKEPFPIYEEPQINYIEDLNDWPRMIKGMASFDYEATALKPHAKNQRIVCASVAYSENIVYVFPMPKRKSQRKYFIEFLTNKNIKKIAANLKYETQWSKEKLGVEVENWYWDTMITAHTLDNRPSITGLKFQAYVQLGIVDYDSEVSAYLKPTDANKKKFGANAINRIDELITKPGGMRKLLKYCALDSIYEYRLALIQMKEMENRTLLPF